LGRGREKGWEGREREEREEGREGVHNLRKTTPRHQMAVYGPVLTEDEIQCVGSSSDI